MVNIQKASTRLWGKARKKVEGKELGEHCRNGDAKNFLSVRKEEKGSKGGWGKKGRPGNRERVVNRGKSEAWKK